jgi:hypothetical protein
MSSHAQQSQGSQDQQMSFRPFTKPAFKYDPNSYMKSAIAVANKRSFQAPANFIGVVTPRPPSMLPERTYHPAGIKGYYNPTIPIMRTQPVQPKFQ